MISRKLKNVKDKEKIAGFLDNLDFSSRITKGQKKKIKQKEKNNNNINKGAIEANKILVPSLIKPLPINKKKAKSLAQNTKKFQEERIDYLSKVHFITSDKLAFFKNDIGKSNGAIEVMLKRYDKIIPSFCKISPEVNLEALEYIASLIKSCKDQEYIKTKDTYKNIVLNLALGIKTFAENFKNDQLAKVVNAMGHLGPDILNLKEKKISVHETCITIYKEIVNRNDYKSEELSLMAEGIGYLNFKPKKLDAIKHISNICTDYYEEVKEYNAKPFLPRIAARLIKGFGLMKYNGCMSFCKEVIKDMTCNMKYYLFKDIADIVSGFANIGYMPSRHEVMAIEDHFNDNYEDFEVNDFSRLIWGLSEIRYFPSYKYFELSLDYIFQNSDKFTSEDVALISRAFGNFGMVPHVEISNFIKKFHDQYLGDFKLEDSISVLVGMAEANVLDFKTLDTAIRRMYTEDTCNIMTLDNKSDLYKCMLDVQAFTPNNEKKEYTGSLLMLDEAKDAWKVDQLTKKIHDHAISILKKIEYWDLNIEPMDKLEIGESFLRCDSAYHPKYDIPIAVLICEISDYYSRANSSSHSNDEEEEERVDKFKGNVAWKIKMLQKYGFSVLTVDLEKWLNLKKESRKDYIKQKIDEVVRESRGKKKNGKFIDEDFGHKFKYWEVKPPKPKNKDPNRRKSNYKPNYDPTKDVFRNFNKGLE